MEDILKQILNKLDSMDNKIASMDSKIVSMDNKIASMDSKIVSMDNKIASMDGKIVSMDNKIASMDSRIVSMDNKITSIEKTQSLMLIQIKEHGEMLSALKTASEFHKADIDNLTHQTANISGDVKTIKNAVTKGEEAYKYVQEIKNIFNHNG